jgi:ABC-type cobalt transport system substrate-binding protein
MIENIVAIVASLVIALVMVYFIDKKFGGSDEGHQG